MSVSTGYLLDRARSLIEHGWIRDVTSLPGGKVTARCGGYTVTVTDGQATCNCAETICAHGLAVLMVVER